MTLPQYYIDGIKERDSFRYFKGLVIRLLLNLKYSLYRNCARKKGASIGKNVIIPLKLALKANSNLIIGDDVICETSNLDLRGKICIESYNIINKDVSILRVSHFIDDDNKFTTRYYPELTIESYSWLCTGCNILPNVTTISKGSVISAFCILSHNTNEMDVIGKDGNFHRKHNSLFKDLVVPSLKGGDYYYYKEARKK